MINPLFDDYITAIKVFGMAVGETTQQIVDAIHPLYDLLYASYVEVGAPYGETHDGFVRWMKERGSQD